MAYAPPPPAPMKRPYQGDWAPPRPAKEPRPPGMGDMYSSPTWGAGYSEYGYYGWGDPNYSESPVPDPYYDNSAHYHGSTAHSNNITVDFTDDYSAFYDNVPTPHGNGSQQGNYSVGPGAGQFQNVMDTSQGGMQNRGQFNPKRGQWNQNRGQFNQTRGQGNFNRGQGNLGRGQFNQTRGQGNLNRGQGNLNRGQFNQTRGQGNLNRGQFNQTRGQGNQNRGQGNLNRGQFHQTRGQGNQNRGRGNQQNRGGIGDGQFSVRGRGGQRGMPPNPRGRGKGSKKASAAASVISPDAKGKPEVTEIENLSVTEKLNRFCTFLKKDDSAKINAVQTIMNAVSSTKLGLKPSYETVDLGKVAGRQMFTGVLSLDSVFLARAVRHNKRDLKQEVFEKAIDNMMSMTVDEIYNLVDPGPEAIRKELNNQLNEDQVKSEDVEYDIKSEEAKSLVGGDVRTILSNLIKSIQKMKHVPESPICVIEQAATAAHLLVKHEYQVDITRMKNGHLFCRGRLNVGAIVIGRGGGITKKRCKVDTYKNTLERLNTLSVPELLESVPEAPVPDTDLESNTSLSLEERFTEFIECLGTMTCKESNIMQMDVAAMKNGLIPMVLFKLSENKVEYCHNIICELYLEKVFMASSEGTMRRDCMTKAYNAAWDVLTTTSVDTLLKEHRQITDEEVKDQTLLDVFVKGSGRTVESNLVGLRRQGSELKEIEERKLEDLIIVENSDWSKDRMKNAFCILQYSCNQNGMILQWESDAVQNDFRCVISVQKQQLGESRVPKKSLGRNTAAVDALFKLYQTQDIIKVATRTDDEKKWIPWESITAEADKLRTEKVEEEEPVDKTDESGASIPDSVVMKVLEDKVDEFVKQKEEDELIIGPGIGLTEGRALRNYAFGRKLKCDTMYFQRTPYLLIYEKLDLKELVSVLKCRDKPYGRFVLVDKEELPQKTEVMKFIMNKSCP